MKRYRLHLAIPLLLILLLAGLPGAWGAAYVQCPSDLVANGGNGNGRIDDDLPMANVECLSITGGDGFITMADERELYIFGFADVTSCRRPRCRWTGVCAPTCPAPTIELRAGRRVLPDPDQRRHGRSGPTCSTRTPSTSTASRNASAVFDGLPEVGLSHQHGASADLLLQLNEPGTYMYHCHVEATEHMQMGMLGNLYVDPLQNKTGIGGTWAPPIWLRKPLKTAATGPGLRLQRRRRLDRLRRGVPDPAAGASTRDFHDAS